MNTFGSYFRTTTWGESHGSAIGTVIDGCPPGIDIKREDIQDELSRRRPGQTVFTSQRNEEDRVDILSGVFNGKTTGTPISLIIYNKDIRSSDYEKLKNIPRPGQADFTYLKKYGIRDYRGSGRASGRETASRVAAGAIAKKILFKEGIVTVGFSAKIGEVGIRNGSLITDYNISREEALKLRELIYRSPVRCPEIETSHKMEKTIQNISKEEDSLGGIIEILSYGVPPGLGSPVFDKLDALIAHAVMSVGAVKGVEIGEGFEIASKKGSTANDVFEFKNGIVKPKTNRAGGILGGISTGMPIVVKAAVKPTPSIQKTQQTVDFNGKPVSLSVEGRHDPCIVVRMVPVLENMLNLVLVDMLLLQKALKGGEKNE